VFTARYGLPLTINQVTLSLHRVDQETQNLVNYKEISPILNLHFRGRLNSVHILKVYYFNKTQTNITIICPFIHYSTKLSFHLKLPRVVYDVKLAINLIKWFGNIKPVCYQDL
jgi:hypothetical protein